MKKLKACHIKCLVRFIYYWFKYPTGAYISGHNFIEIEDNVLECKDCGYISKLV